MSDLFENATIVPRSPSTEGYSGPWQDRLGADRQAGRLNTSQWASGNPTVGRFGGGGPLVKKAAKKPAPKPKKPKKPVKEPAPKEQAKKSKDPFTLYENFESVGEYAQEMIESGGSIPGSLGNKFFLKTPAQCKDIANDSELVDRSLYFNNIPDGDTAFMPSGYSSEEFPTDYSLVPSLWSFSQINSSQLYDSLSKGGTPECMATTLETIDQWGNQGSETGYLTTDDIKGMNPCWFEGNTNPLNPEKECNTSPPPWVPPPPDPGVDQAKADAAERDRQAIEDKATKRDQDAKEASDAEAVQAAKDLLNQYRDTAHKAVESIDALLNEAEGSYTTAHTANQAAQDDKAISDTWPARVDQRIADEKSGQIKNIEIWSRDNENVIEIDPYDAVNLDGADQKEGGNPYGGCYSLNSGTSGVIQGVGKGWDGPPDPKRGWYDLKGGKLSLSCKVWKISLPPNIEAQAYTSSWGWKNICSQEVLQTIPPGALDYEFDPGKAPCAFLFTEKENLVERNDVDRADAATIAHYGEKAAEIANTYTGNVEGAFAVIQAEKDTASSNLAAIPDDSSINIENLNTEEAKKAADAATDAEVRAHTALGVVVAATLEVSKAAVYAHQATRFDIIITGGGEGTVTLDVNKATTLMGTGQLIKGCFTLDQEQDWQTALKGGAAKEGCDIQSIALPLNVEAKAYSGGGGNWNDLCSEGGEGRNLQLTDWYIPPGAIREFTNEIPCGFKFTKVDPPAIQTPAEGFTNLHPSLYNEEDDLYTFFSYLYYFSLLLLFGYIIKQAVRR